MSKFIAILIWSLTAAGFAHADSDRDDWGRHRHPVSAPEIDPGTAGSALTLLAGGLVVLRGRRNKK